MTQTNLSSYRAPEIPSAIDAFSSVSSSVTLDALIALAKGEKDRHVSSRALALALVDGVPLPSAMAIALTCTPEGVDPRSRLKELWDEGDALLHELGSSGLLSESERASLPEWWGTRFATWSQHEGPAVPSAFRNAVAWRLLSDLLGGCANVPLSAGLKTATVSVSLSGGSKSARDEAWNLVGVSDDGTSPSLLEIKMISGTLLASEPDIAPTSESLREHQTGPSINRKPDRLVAEAQDALERLLLSLGEAPVVYSTDAALDRLTKSKVRISRQLGTYSPDIVDEVVSEYSGLLRRMAVLAAIVDGCDVVCLSHQLIALEAAEDSLRVLKCVLEARFADAGQAEVPTSRQMLKNALNPASRGITSNRSNTQ